jgi:hypothetical protein
MWTLGQSRSSRQTEWRRKLAKGQTPWYQPVRRLLGWPAAIATGFWICAALIVLSGDEPLPYVLGQRLSRPVLSRVDFNRANEIRTAELRKNAQQAVPSYFRLNRDLVDMIQAEFRDLHAAAKEAEDFQQYTEAHSQRWPLEQAQFEGLKGMTDEAGSEQFKRHVDTIARHTARDYMIEKAELDREIRSIASHVMIDRGDGKFFSVPKEKLTYAANGDHVSRLAEDLVRDLFAEGIRPALAEIVRKAILPAENQYRPVYVFDRGYTKAKLDEAGSLPPVKDSYRAGDRLVKAGELDGEGLALLKAEHEEYLRRRRVDAELGGQWRRRQLGLLGLIMLVTVGLSVYTFHSQPRVAQKPARALALALLLLLMLLTDRLILLGVGTSRMWSVATITMTAAILTVAYSQRFALGTTAGLALLTILTLDAPLGLLAVLLTTACVVVVLLREIRTRLRMVVVGGITALSAAVGAFFAGLSQQQGMGTVIGEAWYAALAAVVGTSIVLVLLPVIERVFRITTSLTLLEWADTSKPLLRQLIEKAPGTWQHSHLLGSMAEAAAEEIGANGLLVRVGAYYHDIGKMCKPNYFVENQQAKMDAHRGLAPTMSLLVILAHVKDGLALVREHRLPPVLHQFIPEHHGTTMVRYFHAMATQEAKARGGSDREISDSEFRYPGPKPRSREAAILMLGDSVEGAVRSLQDPTPGRIESVVHELTMARLMDGQFDDCEITLKELSRVEQCLVKSLRSIHHGRIAYPEPRPGDASQVRSA